MKWILICVLICVIMLIAHSVTEQYKEKYDFYYNLKIFLNQFKLNLSFKQEKINLFLEKIKAKKQFNVFINSYKDYLRTNELNLDRLTVLDFDDKKQLKSIITNIGQLDAKNEIAQIEHFEIEINEKLEKAKSDKNKLCPMILKLSLLFSIGLAIILI